MKLSELKKKENAKIVGIDKNCAPQGYQRFLDLGFVKGVSITVHNVSPLQDPVAYCIHNTLISLRVEDAAMILIEKEP